LPFISCPFLCARHSFFLMRLPGGLANAISSLAFIIRQPVVVLLWWLAALNS
jgi:hypothetical protein